MITNDFDAMCVLSAFEIHEPDRAATKRHYQERVNILCEKYCLCGAPFTVIPCLSHQQIIIS